MLEVAGVKGDVLLPSCDRVDARVCEKEELELCAALVGIGMAE